MTERFAHPPTRLLVIRRDNIGDLLCTTPLLTALHRRYPAAWIGVLTNAYSAPALAGNPDVDAVFAYDKDKHLDSLPARLGALAKRSALILRLRRLRPDMVLLPAGGVQRSAERFARLVGSRRLARAEDLSLPAGAHEVESAYRCARALGIDGPPPAMTLIADPAEVASVAAGLPPGEGPLIGLHISARKESQRWSVERFVALAQRLHREYRARFLLFWAPGSAADPRHPGDDEKANALAAALDGLPLRRFPTSRLAELIAGLSLCETVVCSDGGAMHIAAALSKPIVCFFGNSDAERWHPWGVPYALLQKDSRRVEDIGVDEVLAAFARLKASAG